MQSSFFYPKLVDRSVFIFEFRHGNEPLAVSGPILFSLHVSRECITWNRRRLTIEGVGFNNVPVYPSPNRYTRSNSSGKPDVLIGAWLTTNCKVAAPDRGPLTLAVMV